MLGEEISMAVATQSTVCGSMRVECSAVCFGHYFLTNRLTSRDWQIWRVDGGISMFGSRNIDDDI